VFIDFLLNTFRHCADHDAIVWRDTTYKYQWLSERTGHWLDVIRDNQINKGTIVILEADFSPNSIALFIALVEAGCVVVPLTPTASVPHHELIEIAEGEICFSSDEDDDISFKRLDCSAKNELYKQLRSREHPGLVSFSSGSAGRSKGVVHDMTCLLDKYKIPRRRLRTISFLRFDHLGGINTMLYTLSNGGCLVVIPDHSPDTVLRAIECHRVQLLPTTPTFINLILISEAYKRYKLDSLEMVTYGGEPMLESTLSSFHRLFPEIRLVQTYGLSEVGVLRSKSKGSDSLWVKIGGEGFETRVVDGILHIKAHSAMLGYLNAPNPYTEDGWFNTRDHVEVDGEYLRIIGRESTVINVGGEKVYPAEVESVIQELDNVAEVAVYGEKNTILGNIVCARVTLMEDESYRLFTARLKQLCQQRLPRYKVPMKVIISSEFHHSARLKKARMSDTSNS
jgi:acyl-CoA synthetase (AMP-forming)/AMP-acid ligase II